MKFGKFSRCRSLLAFCLVLFCSAGLKARAQQSVSPAGNPNPALPAVQPLSQAAAGTVPQSGPAAKHSPAQSSVGSEGILDSSTLKLGAGDLLEVSVYNVPE